MLNTINRLVHHAYCTRVESLVHDTGLYPWLYGAYEHLLGLAYRRDTYTLDLHDTTIDYHTVHDAEIVSLLHTMEKERDIIQTFTSHLDPSDVVWDVGANLGVYTAAAAPFVDRVVGFEPHPVTAGRARENVALNGFENATVREVGLWDADTTSRLATDRNELGTQTPRVSDAGDLRVDLRRGGGVAARPPSVLKVDVEGGETRVLDGLGDSLADVRLVLLEVHDEAVVEWFADRAFELREVGRHNGERFVLAERIEQPAMR